MPPRRGPLEGRPSWPMPQPAFETALVLRLVGAAGARREWSLAARWRSITSFSVIRDDIANGRRPESSSSVWKRAISRSAAARLRWSRRLGRITLPVMASVPRCTRMRHTPGRSPAATRVGTAAAEPKPHVSGHFGRSSCDIPGHGRPRSARQLCASHGVVSPCRARTAWVNAYPEDEEEVVPRRAGGAGLARWSQSWCGCDRGRRGARSNGSGLRSASSRRESSGGGLMSSDRYALANAWALADRRLEALELSHDPVTWRRCAPPVAAGLALPRGGGGARLGGAVAGSRGRTARAGGCCRRRHAVRARSRFADDRGRRGRCGHRFASLWAVRSGPRPVAVDARGGA
jgi:hypothetical protein